MKEWKEINTAQDLPTRPGKYVAIFRWGESGQLSINSWSGQSSYWSENWMKNVVAYVPEPIPEYVPKESDKPNEALEVRKDREGSAENERELRRDF